MSRWADAKLALQRYPKRRGDAVETWAVERALDRQREYYNGEARLRMVDLVYFKGTHTLIGASVETGYSIESVKKWNLEILAAVDGRLDRKTDRGN